MPDLRDDATEDGFHEIQLSRKQLVFLFMTGSVALILVFLFGVVVGRDTASKGADIGIASNEPEGAPETVAAADPPTEVTPPTAQPPEKITYPKTLSGQTPTKEQPQPTPTESTPAAPPPPAPATPAPSAAQPPNDAGPKVPTSGGPGAWVIQVAALRSERTAAEQVQGLITKGYPAFLENPGKGLYRVRVGRFRERVDADRMAQRLEKEGITSVISR